MQAAGILAKSGLGKKELGRLWTVADVDQDGKLSRQEFAVAMHLAACATAKNLPLPSVMPGCLAAIVGAEVKQDNVAAGRSTAEVKKNPELADPQANNGDDPQRSTNATRGDNKTTGLGTTKGKRAPTKGLFPTAGAIGSRTQKDSTMTEKGEASSALSQAASGKKPETSVPVQERDKHVVEGVRGGNMVTKIHEESTTGTSKRLGGGADGGKDVAGDKSISIIDMDMVAVGAAPAAKEPQMCGDDDNGGGDTQPAGATAGDVETATKRAANQQPEIATLSWEERDQLYAMSTAERGGYDVIFMQVRVARVCQARLVEVDATASVNDFAAGVTG